MKLRRVIGMAGILIGTAIMLFVVFQSMGDEDTPVYGDVEVYDGPGDYAGTLVVDGVERSYLVHIPDSYTGAEDVPLVFVLHGGGGSAEQILNQSGFLPISDENGFILIHPDGYENSWNDGRTGSRSESHDMDIDDTAFFKAMIAETTAAFAIDEKRIYATGMSNGAMMSFRLAQDMADYFAAVAPVAGLVPHGVAFDPAEPVSLCIVNNLDDRIVPTDGGEVRVIISQGLVLSLDESVSLWVDYNGCNPVPTTELLLDVDPDDGTRVTKQTYAQGDAGTEVVVYTIDGGGHTWPGADSTIVWRLLAGKTSYDIDAAAIIWDFFATHPKQ